MAELKATRTRANKRYDLNPSVENMMRQFMPIAELSAIKKVMAGPEGEYFHERITELHERISSMPKTGMQAAKEDPMVYLHYFRGGSDWYITERDFVPNEPQHQAFGFAILNGDRQNAELGYISIEELISYGVELELSFRPRPLSEIKAKHRV